MNKVYLWHYDNNPYVIIRHNVVADLTGHNIVCVFSGNKMGELKEIGLAYVGPSGELEFDAKETSAIGKAHLDLNAHGRISKIDHEIGFIEQLELFLSECDGSKG